MKSIWELVEEEGKLKSKKKNIMSKIGGWPHTEVKSREIVVG